MKISQLGRLLLTFGLIQYWCTTHFLLSAEETDKTRKNKREKFFKINATNFLKLIWLFLLSTDSDLRSEFTHSEKNADGSQWNFRLSKDHRRNGHRREMENIDGEFSSDGVGLEQDLSNNERNLVAHSARGSKEIALLNCSNYKHTNLKIYNLRIAIQVSIIDATECFYCPGGKIIVAQKGAECAPLLLPIIKSCPKTRTRTRSRPLRLSLNGNRSVGRILPEGSHMIHLGIQSKSEVRTCTFRYQVKVNRCSIPKCIANGYFRCTEGRAWGSSCHFSCNTGYTMRGNPTSYCEGNSAGVDWTEFPVCKDNTSCDAPKQMENGKLVCDRNKVSNEYPSGTNCTYHCNDCYELENPSYSMIQCYYGYWTDTVPPTCKSTITSSCKTPAAPYNGSLTCTVSDNCDTTLGTVCHYSCRPGYAIPEEQLRLEYKKCIGKNVWNSTGEPECYEHRLVYCEDQKVFINEPIKIQELFPSIGAQPKCTFVSKSALGFYMNTCEATYHQQRIIAWCHVNVEIVDGSCNRPKDIKNGRLFCDRSDVLNQFLSGTTCTYHCDDCYEMDNPSYSTIQCHHGNWDNPVLPNCRSNITSSCEMPATSNNGLKTCTVSHTCDKTLGTVCRYSCHPGYAVPKDQLRLEYTKCIAPNTWNSTEPPECYEHRLVYCENQKVSINEPVKIPELYPSVAVKPNCTFVSQSALGFYNNTCEATYHQQRIVVECHFTVEVVDEACRKPEEIKNGKLFCKVLNEYPSGTICTYQCDDCYEIENPSYSMIQCYHGSWDNPVPPICKSKRTSSCDVPAAPYNGLITCTLSDTCDKTLGTVCRYSCHPGYAIPKDQLQLEYTKCIAPNTWNSTEPPECYEHRLVYCEDQKVFINESIKIPELFPSVGAQPKCTFVSQSALGFYNNTCKATYYQQQTIVECYFAVEVVESNCSTLTTPANTEMLCGMLTDTHIFRCNVKCHSGFYVLSAFETLMNKGYVACDVRTGEWDFTRTYGTKFLPDCLGETDTNMTTGIIFKVTVDDCGNEASIIKIKENIRKGLFNRNSIICSQVDCSDFNYLCNLDQNGISILEISWNITAQFTPVSEHDDYYGSEETPKAEVYLTEIQQNTYSFVINDESFQLQLLKDGATIMEESYTQGLIDLICSKKPYVIEEETYRCLQCPTGSYYSNNACLLCPLNSYQDETGQEYCKTCSDGTVTSLYGSKKETDCFKQNQLPQLPREV